MQVAEGALCGGLLLLWIVPMILWIVIAIWMYKDAQKRDENAVLWLIIGLFLGIIGLIIWFVVRPDMTEVERKRQGPTKTCLSCGQQIGVQYSVCPYCNNQAGSSQQQQYGGQQQYGAPPQQQQPPQQQGRPCPDCGGSMRYVNEYNRWYCDRCQGYK